MRIRVRIDSENEQHIRFTIFQDGGNAGSLCMNTKEGNLFIDSLFNSQDYIAEVVDVS